MPSAERSARRSALAAAVAVGALLSGALSTAAQAAPSASDLKSVSYQGHRFDVPKNWPVVDLAADPTACVRFDQHAVYLGTPGEDQACPTGLVGRTEALLIQPDGTVAGHGTELSEVGKEIVSRVPGLKVTATYADDLGLVRSVLDRAGLPHATSRKAAVNEAPARATAGLTVNGSADLTNHIGKGFDACTAPSNGLMDSWKANSPYGAVGVYIGGSNRACGQSNLTASWVQRQAGNGWRFLPIYVGLYAHQIDPANAAAQGRAAADDAANQAAQLGFGQGSLIYNDMEDYGSAYSGRVLSFLSAWTTRLHERGYNSGVYSSSNSGIADIVNNRSNGYALPEVLFTARWNGAANTDEPVIPAGTWANHRRVHQYRGNTTETWGGYTLQIDQDYLDVQLNGGVAARPTNVGVYRSAEALFAVADHGGGVAGSTMFGNPGDVPLVGDWNGDGKDTFGVYRPSEGWFYLSNDNASVAVSAGFGNPGDVPLVGDWNGDGRDTIGIYRPSTQDFVWTDDNVNVVRTQQMGSAGDVPVVGDWNGDGRDTIGVYRPAEGMFYLTDSGAGASVDHAVPFGNHYENPIVGDWDGDGRDEVGVYRSATAEFLGAAHDSSALAYQVSFGNPGDTPITGTW
ncbi:DUF1906 domain-containing protein [Streptomyces sp. CBMA156]|uniref:DUF1906 domain-containing protein n=1 Tax=Streptomyces sp. CBMA156 TaxID=1930280 RepID=UPI001661CCB6|nr:DUF1906 domain-containing protein [Streptomyces sp. CBMA156]MBD0674168.1 hypothetical protein [Streptomyces sp. CBMA156]